MNHNNSLSLAKDPEFLLRCALTHNWDTLVDFCSIIQATFTISAVPDHLHHRHLHEIAAARKQLAACDEWGNHVLQAACYNRPPVQVVEAILNALEAAAACRHYSYDTADDDDDNNNNNNSSSKSSSNNTAQYLLFHLQQARDGSTALQVACACGASIDVIRTLLDTPQCGSLVAVSDTTGCTALSDLVVQYVLERKSPQHRGSLPLNEIHFIPQENESLLFETFWTKVELLLRAAWFADGQVDDNGPQHREGSSSSQSSSSLRNLRGSSYISIVHGLAHVAEAVPSTLTELVCRCYSHMLSLSDPRGVLPIHICLSKEGRHRQNMMHPKARERRNLVIQKLLQADPDVASQPIPMTTRTQQHQQQEQSPLACAIQSELYWHMDDGSEGPVQTLWKLAPSKLGEVDQETNMFPFMMAATLGSSSTSSISSSSLSCSSSNRKSLSQEVRSLISQQGQAIIENDEQTKEQDRLALDTIYCMIRVDPLILLTAL